MTFKSEAEYFDWAARLRAGIGADASAEAVLDRLVQQALTGGELRHTAPVQLTSHPRPARIRSHGPKRRTR